MAQGCPLRRHVALRLTVGATTEGVEQQQADHVVVGDAHHRQRVVRRQRLQRQVLKVGAQARGLRLCGVQVEGMQHWVEQELGVQRRRSVRRPADPVQLVDGKADGAAARARHCILVVQREADHVVVGAEVEVI